MRQIKFPRLISLQSLRFTVAGLFVTLCSIFVGCSSDETDQSRTVKKDPVPQVVWSTSYSEGLAIAKKTGKPMLVDFTGKDWCGPCMELKKNVFDTDTFKRWADKNVVLIELDFPPQNSTRQTPEENIQFARQYRIQGYPTVLFISPDEQVLGRTGYGQREDAVSWIKRVKQFVEKETVKTKSESGS